MHVENFVCKNSDISLLVAKFTRQYYGSRFLEKPLLYFSESIMTDHEIWSHVIHGVNPKPVMIKSWNDDDSLTLGYEVEDITSLLMTSDSGTKLTAIRIGYDRFHISVSWYTYSGTKNSCRYLDCLKLSDWVREQIESNIESNKKKEKEKDEEDEFVKDTEQ